MVKIFRILLISLALLAVGAAQIFGVKAGYLCGCTGQQLNQEECEAMVCHPQQPHEDGCEAELTKAACSDHGQNPQAPAQHQHKHSEVRRTLIVTGVPPALALPAVVLLDIPHAFLAPDSMTPIASFLRIECPEPPEYGSPPMPLLVARTMVMLV